MSTLSLWTRQSVTWFLTPTSLTDTLIFLTCSPRRRHSQHAGSTCCGPDSMPALWAILRVASPAPLRSPQMLRNPLTPFSFTPPVFKLQLCFFDFRWNCDGRSSIHQHALLFKNDTLTVSPA